jgi:hypothetical protein
VTARRKSPWLVASGGKTRQTPAPLRGETETPDVARLPDVAGHPAGGEVAPSPPPLPGLFGGEALDRMLHAGMARFTAGISPAAVGLAFTDWWMHLAASPGKQAELMQAAWSNASKLALTTARTASGTKCDPCIAPERGDKRFQDAAWCQPPFDLVSQSSCSASSGGKRRPPACAASPTTTRL